MCFVPACFEMAGMILLAPRILGISTLDAAIMGAVVAAVSPAVVVPKMIKLMEEGYGVKQGIPQLILAGASVDDVFVIVMFTAFTGLAQGEAVSLKSFVNVPLSVITGILVGLAAGYLLAKFFEKVHIRDTSKVTILLERFLYFGNSRGLCWTDDSLCFSYWSNGSRNFPAEKREVVAKRLSSKFNKLWVVSEIMLFVLVGAAVDIQYAVSGIAPVFLIF